MYNDNENLKIEKRLLLFIISNNGWLLLLILNLDIDTCLVLISYNIVLQSNNNYYYLAHFTMNVMINLIFSVLATQTLTQQSFSVITILHIYLIIRLSNLKNNFFLRLSLQIIIISLLYHGKKHHNSKYSLVNLA